MQADGQQLADITTAMAFTSPVQIREICGSEELAGLPANELAVALSSNGYASESVLTLSQVDSVLVDVYKSLFGDTVQYFAHCSSCQHSFETSFKLDDWLGSLVSEMEVPENLSALADGVYQLQDEHGTVQFRLPTVEDVKSLQSVHGDNTDQLLIRRCVLSGDVNHPGIEASMGVVGPLLEGDITSDCAYCGSAQATYFSLADYVLSLLDRERPLVMREVHCLAIAYRWSRAEILSMSRSERRQHVQLILAETTTEEDFWS